MFTSTTMKFVGSVETASQATVFCPLVNQPVELVGWVTVMAKAEAANAKREATARISRDDGTRTEDFWESKVATKSKRKIRA